jgi:hypothetical protein
MVGLDTVTIEDFSPCVGEVFDLRIGSEGCQVVLQGAQEKSRYARNGQSRMPFSLIFLGPEGGAFQQGTYSLGHEKLGELELFLVPVGIEQGRMQLEAVFN